MVDLELTGRAEARTLVGCPARGKARVTLARAATAAVLCALSAFTGGCGDALAPRTPTIAVTSARALAPLAWHPLKLLPKAAVAPPPARLAPAFDPAAASDPRRDDRGDTAGASLGTTSAGWLVGATAPREGTSLRLRPSAHERGAAFGTPTFVAALEHAAARVARDFPGSVLWVGDLSREAGGPLAPHASHTSGRDVDLCFYVSRRDGDALAPADGPAMRVVDGGGRIAGAGGELVFDTARNWALVQALLEDPGATPQWIFVARHLRLALLDHARAVAAPPSLIAKAEAVLAQPGDSSPHADHFHVRVYCGEAERLEGCLDAPPFHPFAPRHDAALARWLDGLLPFLQAPREPETREAIERIVRMNAQGAVPALEALAARADLPDALATLTRDALDFLRGRRTPEAWRRWRPDAELRP